MSNDTYDRATVEAQSNGGRLSGVWDTLQNLRQNVETVVRQSRFEISGGGVDQIDAPDDLDELVDLAKKVGFVWVAYDVFASEVWEPGYRVEGPDETVAYFMGEQEELDATPPEGTPEGGFLSNCGVYAGEKQQDFYDVGKATTFQRRLRGTVLHELLKKDPEDPESEISGFYFIRPETVSAEVYPNQNILIDPDDTDVDGVEITPRGEAAAYIQFDDDSILGRRGTFDDDEEIPLSQNDVHKQVLNPGIGDDASAEQGVFGTPGLEPISEDLAEYTQIKRDRATAIGNKAHGIWLIEHGREVYDLGDQKELVEWDDDSMSDFESALEDINPGGYVTHDGSVTPERVDGDVPDLSETMQEYVDSIFSGLPVSKYKVGFEDNVNRDVTSEQSDSDLRQIEEEREYQERQWTQVLKTVAERKGLPTDGLQLKIEPEPEDSPVMSMTTEEIDKLATYADALNSLAGPQGGPQTLVDRETLLTDIAQLPESAEMGEELAERMGEEVDEETEALWREMTIESGDTGNRDALAGDSSEPFADVPVIPTGIEELTPAWLIRWAEWVAAGKPEIPEKDTLDWNPALHPRDPNTGKFVERPFNVPDDMPDLSDSSPVEILGFISDTGGDVEAVLDSDISIDGVPDDVTSMDDIRTEETKRRQERTGGFNEVSDETGVELAKQIPTSDERQEIVTEENGAPITDELADDIYEAVGGVLSRTNDQELAREYARRTGYIGDESQKKASYNGPVSLQPGDGQRMVMAGDDKGTIRHEMGHGIAQSFGFNDQDTSHAWDRNYWPGEGSDPDELRSLLVGRDNVDAVGFDEWQDDVDEEILGPSFRGPQADLENMAPGDLLKFEDSPSIFTDSEVWEITGVSEGASRGVDYEIRDKTGFTDTVKIRGGEAFGDEVENTLKGFSDPERAEGGEDTEFTGRPVEQIEQAQERVSELNAEEKVREYVSQANRAFYKMHQASDKLGKRAREQHTIKDAYSSTNAHEAISQMNEVMQTDIDHVAREAAQKLSSHHPQLLGTYMAMFDPSPTMREKLNEEVPGLD